MLGVAACQHPHPLSRESRGEDLLGMSLGVVGDETHGGAHDVAGGAVVLAEEQAPGVLMGEGRG